jgi:ABC-type sulfate/molybdate transport systems ATPase subunit
MSEIMIEAHGLALMQDGARVLDDISFSLARGQCLAIVGRSGSGKTLLLRMLAGLERASEGRLHIAGQSAQNLPECDWHVLRRDIGLVLENGALLHDLTLAENLAFPLSNLHLADSEIEKRLEHCLINFDLDPWRNARSNELSANLTKRALLARALIKEPRILMLDAPFEGLDPEARAELQADLKRLVAVQNVALLVTLHDKVEAASLGAEILMLERGRLSRLNS